MWWIGLGGAAMRWIGLGVYAAEARPSTTTSTFPTYVEERGHLWELSDRVGSAPGVEELEARAPDHGSPVLVVVSLDAVGVQVLADFDGDEQAFQNATGTRGVAFRQVVSPGAPVGLRLFAREGDPGTIGPGDTFQLGFYERAD